MSVASTDFDLTAVLDAMKAALGIGAVEEMPGVLMQACENNDEEAFSAFVEAVPDLDTDWLQKIFQYYIADRKEKMQDYSPESLGDLLAEFAGEGESILDVCAGSGALTIRCWAKNRSRRFVCVELDEAAVSLLLFNLASRNIESVVLRRDVLSQETFDAWTVKKGDRFGVVERGGEPFECDFCVSNPPYNMKWRHPDFAPMQPRFQGLTVPPESNANYAFVLSAMESVERGAFILPNGALSSVGVEGKVRSEIVEDNWIDAVVACPDRMFESTSIPVCVVAVDKGKKTASVEMVDARETYDVEVRDQRGQYGSKSHTSRVYHKNVSVLTRGHVGKIAGAIRDRANEIGFCAPATVEQIRRNEYNLAPARYIDKEVQDSRHRPYEDIVNDLNDVAREKGGLKLTINETLARSIGLVEVYEAQQRGNELAERIEETMRHIVDGCAIERPVYLQLSKKKNEVKFENGRKDKLSEILLLIMQQWKSKLYYLNGRENVYLAELRDALLPELMSGKIDLTESRTEKA